MKRRQFLVPKERLRRVSTIASAQQLQLGALTTDNRTDLDGSCLIPLHDGPIAQRTLLRAVQIGCAMALCASSTMRVMTVCAWSRRSRHKALFRPTSPQASLPVAEQFLLPGTGHRDWSFHRHGDFRWKCRRGGGCYWHGHDPRHRWHSRWLHPCRCGADYSTRDGAYDGVTVIGCGGGFNTGGLTRPPLAVIRGGTPD